MQIQVTAILLQMLNFGLVLGGLTYLLLKPVRKILAQRAERIATAQKAAEETIREKAAIAELKDKAAKEARLQTKELLTQARADADQKHQEWLAEAKADVTKLREKAAKSLVAEKAALVESMQADFAEAVFAVAGRVLGAEINTKQHDQLIKTGLKEIAAAN